MPPVVLLILLATLRETATRFEQDALQAAARDNPGEALALRGAAEGVRYSLRAIETASQVRQPHLEAVP